MRHQQQRVDLVDELLRIRVGRELARTLRRGSCGHQLPHPLLDEHADPLLDAPGVGVELRAHGGEEAAAGEHVAFEVREELLGQRP